MEQAVNKYFIKNKELIESRSFDGSFIERGKSLYEVLRVIDGVPVFLEQHIQRLQKSADLTGVVLPLETKNIKQRLDNLILANQIKVGNIKFVLNYSLLDDSNPVFYAYFIKHKYPSTEDYQNGVKTILYHAERDNPAAKVVNVDFRKNANQKIQDAGAYEAILVDNKGFITEASRANIFMIKGNKVYTAPSAAVLSGITRAYIIEICKEMGYDLVEKRIEYTKLSELDGLFISGTSPRVLPIQTVDDLIFTSADNQVIKDIMQAYNHRIDEYVQSKANKIPQQKP